MNLGLLHSEYHPRRRWGGPRTARKGARSPSRRRSSRRRLSRRRPSRRRSSRRRSSRRRSSGRRPSRRRSNRRRKWSYPGRKGRRKDPGPVRGFFKYGTICFVKLFCFRYRNFHIPAAQNFCQLKWPGLSRRNVFQIKIYYYPDFSNLRMETKSEMTRWLCSSFSSLPFKHITTSTKFTLLESIRGENLGTEDDLDWFLFWRNVVEIPFVGFSLKKTFQGIWDEAWKIHEMLKRYF